MRPEERDAAYLWDMLDAARTIHHLTTGFGGSEYMQDRKLQLAVERLLEIIGEAARRVSEAFRQTHPQIPWRGIIALRNVLAHEYGEIEHERIWSVVTERIPELITSIERMNLPSPPPDPEEKQ